MTINAIRRIENAPVFKGASLPGNRPLKPVAGTVGSRGRDMDDASKVEKQIAVFLCGAAQDRRRGVNARQPRPSSVRLLQKGSTWSDDPPNRQGLARGLMYHGQKNKTGNPTRKNDQRSPVRHQSPSEWQACPRPSDLPWFINKSHDACSTHLPGAQSIRHFYVY